MSEITSGGMVSKMTDPYGKNFGRPKTPAPDGPAAEGLDELAGWRSLSHTIEYDPTWPDNLPNYCAECSEGLAEGDEMCGFNTALVALVKAAEERGAARALEEAADTCTCGHEPHQHDPEAVPSLCMVCGDNTRCNYADPEEIAADRWDEGYIAAVSDLTPPHLVPNERLLWSLEHMPRDNPYRPDDTAAHPVDPTGEGADQ